LGNLVIESSVLGLEIIFEHRVYLPSMFAILAVVLLIGRLIKPQVVKMLALCALVFICSHWTIERNRVWQSEVALWEDCVEKSPQKSRPHNNLGKALAERGRVEEATIQFLLALQFDPQNAGAHNNLGAMLMYQGRRSEALFHFQEALRLVPGYAHAKVNLKKALEIDSQTAQSPKVANEGY
jgi:tetratricopeptide (TPR) repeat protein